MGPPLIHSLILDGDQPRQKYLSALRGLNSTKNKQGPGPSPSSASVVVMNNMFLSISYQIMLDCWRENPVDRPTFERLRNTMKEMEGNHKVRRVRETIMDTEGSFREEANVYSRAEAERTV